MQLVRQIEAAPRLLHNLYPKNTVFRFDPLVILMDKDADFLKFLPDRVVTTYQLEIIDVVDGTETTSRGTEEYAPPERIVATRVPEALYAFQGGHYELYLKWDGVTIFVMDLSPGHVKTDLVEPLLDERVSPLVMRRVFASFGVVHTMPQNAFNLARLGASPRPRSHPPSAKE